MLDRAEEPEKMVRLMIQEMEDTLVEIKASCAGAMATQKRVQRELQQTRDRATRWEEKAQLAVNKGREDLAREALREKRRYRERVDTLEEELLQSETVIDQYQSDIGQLEDKLGTAREKQRLLIQRHIQAQKHKRAQTDIRHFENSDSLLRFEQFESRIDRMEAEADLVNARRKPSLEEEFDRLEGDEEIEQELATLKAGTSKQAQNS
jgi:phage shock protein A